MILFCFTPLSESAESTKSRIASLRLARGFPRPPNSYLFSRHDLDLGIYIYAVFFHCV